MSSPNACNAACVSHIVRPFVLQVLEHILSPERERSKGDVALAPGCGVVHPGGGILLAAAQTFTADYLTCQHEHPPPAPNSLMSPYVRDAKVSPPVTIAT